MIHIIVEKPKVVFLAPTSELVKQQLEKIKDYIALEYVDRCCKVGNGSNFELIRP